MDIEFGHKIEYEQPLTVEVERGQRGGYGWAIKLHGEMPSEVVRVIKETDEKLRALFLVKGEETKDDSKEHPG